MWKQSLGVCVLLKQIRQRGTGSSSVTESTKLGMLPVKQQLGGTPVSPLCEGPGVGPVGLEPTTRGLTCHFVFRRRSGERSWSGLSLHRSAARRRCHPSSLYTFRGFPRLGSGLPCQFPDEGFPDFEWFHSAVSDRALLLKSAALPVELEALQCETLSPHGAQASQGISSYKDRSAVAVFLSPSLHPLGLWASRDGTRTQAGLNLAMSVAMRSTCAGATSACAANSGHRATVASTVAVTRL